MQNKHQECPESAAPDAWIGTCINCGSADVSPYLAAPDRFYGSSDLYKLIGCESCLLVWLVNRPRQERMSMHYGADYAKVIAAAGRRPDTRWLARVETLKKYKRTGVILDVGCSCGSFLSTLEQREWKKYGMDISPQAAKVAHAVPGAQVFVGDISDAPYLPESFDAITCFDVFEHLAHPPNVLESISRWLRPGGVFYVQVPNIHSAGARIFGSYWYALELPRHFYFFSPMSLTAMAKASGLEVASISVHPTCSLHIAFGILWMHYFTKLEYLAGPWPTVDRRV